MFCDHNTQGRYETSLVLLNQHLMPYSRVDRHRQSLGERSVSKWIQCGLCSDGKQCKGLAIKLNHKKAKKKKKDVSKMQTALRVGSMTA